MKARRYNKGKNRLNLIPPEILEELGKVYTYGAHKYSLYKDEFGNILKGSEIPFNESSNYEIVDDGANNWKLGLPTSNYLDSALRHIEEYRKGIELDELGTHTLANAMWNLGSIIWTNKYKPELDDRDLWYKKPLKKVWLDLDGVLFDFEKHFLDYFGLPKDYVVEDWDDYNFRNKFKSIIDNNQFWLDIPPLITSSDITYPITGYCTARPFDIEFIHLCLEKWGFPKKKIINVGIGGLKSEVLKGVCDIMVDDSITNFIDLNSNGVTTYLMTRPHNIKYDVGNMRVNNIKEFFDKIRL